MLNILGDGFIVTSNKKFLQVKCDCGVEKIISINSLKDSTKSCGCLRRRKIAIELAYMKKNLVKKYEKI